MNEHIEFIQELKKYIPTHSHLDEGVNFNLYKVHEMIDEYLKYYRGLKK